jgi:hypothetical protein
MNSLSMSPYFESTAVHTENTNLYGSVWAVNQLIKVFTAVIMKISISLSKIPPPAFTRISCSVYSTMKLEAIFSSETPVDYQRTTRYYIPGDSALQNIYNIISINFSTFIYERGLISLWLYKENNKLRD